MTEDLSSLAGRLDAVERALGRGDRPPTDAADGPAVEDRLAAVEDRLDEVEARLDELDAAVQAVRGYVGGVRAVNRDVERRADLALARTEALAEDDGGLSVERLPPEPTDGAANPGPTTDGADGEDTEDGNEGLPGRANDRGRRGRGDGRVGDSPEGRREDAPSESSAEALADRLREVIER